MNTEPTTDTERGELPSASGMERFIACAGSHEAQRGLPPLPEQKVTSQGTGIHGAMETGDATHLEEDEQEIAVRLERLELKAVADWAEANGFDEHDRSRLARKAEVRNWIRDRKTLEPIASAKKDVYYVVREFALILDFKSGFKDATPSERNWQLLTQAVALWHEHPEITDFTVGIAASRLRSSLDRSHYGVEELRYAEFQINAALWRSKQANAPRSPGSWCQYCRANGVCPTAGAYSLLELQRLPAGPLEIATAIQQMDANQMKDVWKRSKIADFIFEAVKNRLERMPVEVLASVGLGLKEGANLRKITDVSAARAKLGLILTPAEIDACSSLALGKLATAAKKGSLSSKQASQLVDATLEGTISVTQNKSSLVEL
jgi:Protein of unknown function (DUF2800)